HHHHPSFPTRRSSDLNAIAYLKAHPDDARYTDSPASAVLESGLGVTVHGPQGMSIHTDMPKSVGGSDQSPSPGWLLRAAQASCLDRKSTRLNSSHSQI